MMNKHSHNSLIIGCTADELTEQIAYHEAGHAVVGIYFGIEPTRIDITHPDKILNGKCRGSTTWHRAANEENSLKSCYLQSGNLMGLAQSTIITYAGGIAEVTLYPVFYKNCSNQGDIRQISKITNYVLGSKVNARRFMMVARTATFKLLKNSRIVKGIEFVSTALQKKYCLQGKTLHKLIDTVSDMLGDNYWKDGQKVLEDVCAEFLKKAQ